MLGSAHRTQPIAIHLPDEAREVQAKSALADGSEISSKYICDFVQDCAGRSDAATCD
jgi:hypothetical protein